MAGYAQHGELQARTTQAGCDGAHVVGQHVAAVPHGANDAKKPSHGPIAGVERRYVCANKTPVPHQPGFQREFAVWIECWRICYSACYERGCNRPALRAEAVDKSLMEATKVTTSMSQIYA